MSLVPGWWHSSLRIQGQVTQFGLYILNLYYITGSWKVFCYTLTGIMWQREAVWVAAEMETCDQEPCTQPNTTITKNTSAFKDNSRHKGKKLNSTSLLRLLSSFPISYTCYQYTAVSNYLYFVCSDVGWCQLVRGTVETEFVYFLIVKWTLHSAGFYQQSNNKSVNFRDIIDAI